MAEWKETLEPYVKVQESIKTASVVPTAGEDLIVGATIISDAGPATPVLITSQTEFLSTFASKDLTEDYVKSLNNLYDGDDKETASTMWLNAYRLAGSVNLLVSRATKANDANYSKPLVADEDLNSYLLRDGELMKRVESFKIAIDETSGDNNGWAFCLNGVGILGTWTTDDGAQYDYYTRTLGDLVDTLNSTSKFFSPNYTFYSTAIAAEGDECTGDVAKSVVFNEAYLGSYIVDESLISAEFKGLINLTTEDIEGSTTIDLNSSSWSGFVSPKYFATNKYNSSTELTVRIRRFNHDAVVSNELPSTSTLSKEAESPYIVLSEVLDTFMSATGEKKKAIEERDFFEVAIFDPSISGEVLFFNIGNIPGRGDMTIKEVNDSLNMIELFLPTDLHELDLDYWGYSGDDGSKWEAYTGSAAATKTYDTVAKMNADRSQSNGTICQVIPIVTAWYKYCDPYFEYNGTKWVYLPNPTSSQISSATGYANKEAMKAASATRNDIAKFNTGKKWYSFETDLEAKVEKGVGVITFSSVASMNSDTAHPDGSVAKVVTRNTDAAEKYQYVKVVGEDKQIFVELEIDPTQSQILRVSDTDLIKAFDNIDDQGVYTVEGLTDLGCTSTAFQTNLATRAINSNYFYPISTVNSTNYLTIANSAKRLPQDSYKLYMSAPWDIDTGTVGFKFYASPSVLYWETVGRNRRLKREFASVLGQTNGQVQISEPVAEFNKKVRQLLLSKKINTPKWDTQVQTYCMNDNYTKQVENTIMNDEANSRLFIRINKAIEPILRPFIGRRISDILYKDAEQAINYWFDTTITPLTYTVDAYRVTIANLPQNNDNARRQNKMYVLVEVRFPRALKFVTVYLNAFDMGMEFTGEI